MSKNRCPEQWRKFVMHYVCEIHSISTETDELLLSTVTEEQLEEGLIFSSMTPEFGIN